MRDISNTKQTNMNISDMPKKETPTDKLCIRVDYKNLRKVCELHHTYTALRKEQMLRSHPLYFLLIIICDFVQYSDQQYDSS